MQKRLDVERVVLCGGIRGVIHFEVCGGLAYNAKRYVFLDEIWNYKQSLSFAHQVYACASRVKFLS
jgi:hypothetical protein